MSWPNDKEHEYAAWLESPDGNARFRGYITAHPKAGRDGRRTRFAVRFDLSGDYPSRAAAEKEAFELANRFFRKEITPSQVEVADTVKAYRVIGGARFRIDRRAWEPVLKIKSKRSANRGAIQTFSELDSPFHLNTFSSAEMAARFGFSYGERMVLGLVGGLHV